MRIQLTPKRVHLASILGLIVLALAMLNPSTPSATYAAERVLCTQPGDSPDLTGPKDAFTRPMRCVSGEAIMYTADDPKPERQPGLQSAGSDMVSETDLFGDPILIEGRPTWSQTGSVVFFKNGDIAYTTSHDPVWGENYLKVVRPSFKDGQLTFSTIYNGLIQGRHLGGMVIADVDGDGFQDVVVVSSDDPREQNVGLRGNTNIFWGENSDNSAFSRIFFEVGNTPYAVAAAEYAGGKHVVGVHNWNSNVFAANKTTTGRTLAQAFFPGTTDQAGWDKATSGDVNNDGHEDIVVGLGQYARGYRFFLGDGNGNFVEAPSMGKPTNMTYYDPFSIAALRLQDVSLDSRDDMLVATGGNFNPNPYQWGSRIWQYNQLPAPIVAGTVPYSNTPKMFIADDIPSSLDVVSVTCGDNDPDLWVFSDGWERSMYFKGLPEGGFDTHIYLEPNRLYANGTYLNDVATGDINGDGLVDEVASYDFNGVNYRLHRPCVELTKKAPSQVKPGASFDYTLAVTNTGLLPIAGMVITDKLPLGVINPTPSAGTMSQGVFTSPAFDLAAGEVKTFTIRVTTTAAKILINSDYYACSKAACTGQPAPVYTTVIDPVPTVQFDVLDVYVGEAGPSAVLNVRLSETVQRDVTVGVRLYGGTATLQDLQLSTPSITIRGGTLTTQVVVSISEDQLVEGEEFVNVQLTGPGGANLGANAVAKVHILDNDPTSNPPGTGTCDCKLYLPAVAH